MSEQDERCVHCRLPAYDVAHGAYAHRDDEECVRRLRAALTAAESALSDERKRREEAERSRDESTTMYLRERERANAAASWEPAFRSERARAEAAEGEVARLAECLKRANASHEEYERRYYIEMHAADDLRAEVARLRRIVDAWTDAAHEATPNDHTPAALKRRIADMNAMADGAVQSLAEVARLTRERDDAQKLVVDQREVLLDMRLERDEAREAISSFIRCDCDLCMDNSGIVDCGAYQRMESVSAEHRVITPADVAHVATTAINAVADVKDAEIARLTRERDCNAEAFVALARAVGGRVDVAGAVEDAHRLTWERDEARANFRRCAEAIGVVYEADGHATQPGPIEDVERAITAARRRSDMHIDCDMAIREAREVATRNAKDCEHLRQSAIALEARSIAIEAAERRALVAMVRTLTGRDDA